jgi:hypothetical protein
MRFGPICSTRVPQPSPANGNDNDNGNDSALVSPTLPRLRYDGSHGTTTIQNQRAPFRRALRTK